MKFRYLSLPGRSPPALCAQELTPAKLLKPPTDAWPTYNGDYSGRRFSPLTQINSSNVHTLSLAWATRFGGGGGGRGGAGGGGNISIKSTPLMVNGILYFTVAQSRLGRRRAHRPRTLALPIPAQHRQHHRQPRRRHVRQLAVLRNAGQQPGQPGRGDRQRALEGPPRRSQARLHVHGRAGGRRQSRDRGHRRRSPGQPRLRRIARSRDRQAAMEVVDHAAQRRARHRNLARRIRRRARHRPGLDSRHLRSRAEPVHRGHRQSESGHGGEEPQGRQPLHLLHRRAQSRHRQDGLVFPAVAARRARLGRRRDARARSTA